MYLVPVANHVVDDAVSTSVIADEEPIEVDNSHEVSLDLQAFHPRPSDFPPTNPLTSGVGLGDLGPFATLL